MQVTPIDRYFAAKCVKGEVDKAYKEAETEAALFLDEARENGQTSLVSTYFGEDAGEYKRGKTRTKHVVEFNLANSEELEDWVNDNAYTMFLFAKDYAEELGQWCLTNTGEIPDGIAHVEYDEPPKLKAPQIYRYDHERVKKVLAQGGNLLEGANQLLLGDGDE